ncbi:ATP-binding cassette domain-containing protein [Streptomyces sp. NBC_01220]|uniref:ATP-binding cassette domain-containing protein n=1 Tax=unclassified Streptomyces TaxID=2593676 RepID=UPI002E2DCD2F|nr:ATP-binding cassette domain-containing protein [Streptomyces sp. NBC_00184]WSQ44915.1 ATP-binding cassette domain-containing protein [Streptomyces sp. NBC_01220]
MIRAYELTKRYGDTTVVQDLDFTVRPGTVTGFLGPNGAGKSTTMRMLLGLDAPTRGRSTIGGRSYATHSAPLTEVGALLEARSVHPGRTAFHHLMALAHTHGIPRGRVEHVLDLAGLTSVAGKRVKGFSLGMGQRLGIAAAMLGDPATLILDEPVNGLDPEGVLWIRTLLKSLATQGRTVLVSSHLMSEMALTADHLVIIGRGRLLADTTVADFVATAGGTAVKVVTPRASALCDLLRGPGIDITGADGPDALEIRGTDSAHIGRVAAAHAIPLYELTPLAASLEQAFMDLTQESVEYRVTAPEPTGALA